MYRQFNIQQLYFLPTQCIYVFCVNLTTTQICQAHYQTTRPTCHVVISVRLHGGPVVVCSDVVRTYHVTRNNTPIHNILSTAPQLSISQKALGTLPEDGNVMPKLVVATVHN
jgi:hypothetical protein